MTIRWTKRAVRSLDSIHSYISKDSPDAAARVAAAILDATVQLENFPRAGGWGESKAPANWWSQGSLTSSLTASRM